MSLIKYEIIKYREKSVFRIIESNIPGGYDNIWSTIPFITISGYKGFDNRFSINNNGDIIQDNNIHLRHIHSKKEVYLFGTKNFQVDNNNQICIGIPYKSSPSDIYSFTNDTWILNKDIDFITRVLNNLFTELKKYIK